MSESIGDFWVRKHREFTRDGGPCPMCGHRNHDVAAAPASQGAEMQVELDPQKLINVASTGLCATVRAGEVAPLRTAEHGPTKSQGAQAETCKVETVYGLEELPQWVDHDSLSNNGSGKEWASYLLIEYSNYKVCHSSAMEPEDATFGRDLKWIAEEIKRAYAAGQAAQPLQREAVFTTKGEPGDEITVTTAQGTIVYRRADVLRREVEELRELSEKATQPLPWIRSLHGFQLLTHDSFSSVMECDMPRANRHKEGCVEQHLANLDFIVACVNLVRKWLSPTEEKSPNVK